MEKEAKFLIIGEDAVNINDIKSIDKMKYETLIYTNEDKEYYTNHTVKQVLLQLKRLKESNKFCIELDDKKGK